MPETNECKHILVKINPNKKNVKSNVILIKYLLLPLPRSNSRRF